MEYTIWEAVKRKFKVCIQKISVIPQRYVFCVIILMTKLLSGQIGHCFKVTMTEMVVVGSNEDGNKNETHLIFLTSDNKFNWSQETQNLILSSSSWASIFTSVISGMVADKYGGKHFVGFGLLWASISLTLVPVTAGLGVPYLIVNLVCISLGEGFIMSAITVLIVRWFPLEERGFISCLTFTTGISLAASINNFLVGWILDIYNGDWSMVFYIFGGAGAAWFLIWESFTSSEPSLHPFITQKEKLFLSEKIIPKSKVPAPWKKILTSVPVWAYVIAHTAVAWTNTTFSTYFPMYLKKILNYSVIEDSYIFSLPSIAVLISAIPLGFITDYIIRRRWLSVTNTRKSFGSISLIGMSVSLLLATYSGCNRVAAVAFFVLSEVFSGAYYASIKVNLMDLSPIYAGSLLTISMLNYSVVHLINPYIIGLLTPNFSISEWITVFWISGSINIASNLIYLIFASGEIQPWNDFKITET